MRPSISNRTSGTRFEDELCNLLAEQGWWAHNLSQNQTGQPADVIAAKNNTSILIDCKVCGTNKFPLSRVEANQEGAMTVWSDRVNDHCYFAMKLPNDSIYMISFYEIQAAVNSGKSSITINEDYCTFDEWLRVMRWLGC